MPAVPPVNPKARYDVGPGHPPLTVDEIAAIAGLGTSQIRRRITYGITGADLLEPKRDRPQARSGGCSSILQERLRLEEAERRGRFKAPVGYPRRYDVGEDKPLTQKQIAWRIGASVSVVSRRVNEGWYGPALLAPPCKTKNIVSEIVRRFNDEAPPP